MEDIRGIQHPLQTPLVLECIFKNLGVSDLMACRQVCRAWREEATPVVRPLTKVTIHDDKEGRGVANFLELVQSEASTFSESPFVNEFHIYDLNYAEKDRAFWEFCGRSIKLLHLVEVSFPTDDEFGHALFQSCPNLEALFLDDVKVNPEGHVGDQPVIWAPPRFPPNRNLKYLEMGNSSISGLARMEILSHFPCLENLQLEISEDNVNVDWIFRSLTILRERDNQGWPLKSVGVDLSCLEEPLAILPVLVEGNLALEEFHALGIAEPEHGIVVRRILEAHANSLKTLTMWSSFTERTADAFDELNNVRLEKLEFLELNEMDLSSTNFLCNVPNLRHLVMFGSLTVQPEDPNDDWILTHCTELELHMEDDDDELELGYLQSLLRRLPNLEKLGMSGGSNDMFAVICDLCPKLTYLNLWRCEVDDCGISGLDAEDVERINQEGANGRTWWRPITVARPNLSSLKSLKWFRYEADNSLGFCAALCGVQQLPQLQHLCLFGFPVEMLIWKRLIDQYSWVDP